MQFINETAYIQIALRGKNFCMAAFDGFQAVINNGMRYLVVAGVGKLMMFLGRLLIAAGSTLAFYCLITFVTSIKATVIEPLYLLVVHIILFRLSSSFLMQLVHSSSVCMVLPLIQFLPALLLIR